MAELVKQVVKVVDIETLKHHPKNPRKGNIESIRESIRVNGFYGALVVQKSTNYVLAGNHRLKAAKAEGITEVPVAFVDVDDETAIKIVLADNRTNDVAEYDDAALSELLASVSNQYGLDGTGFDEDFLEKLITGINGAPTIEDAFGSLCGEESREIMQMTFTVHDSQRSDIEQALEIALQTHSESDVNKNKNGNALHRICEVFLGR